MGSFTIVHEEIQAPRLTDDTAGASVVFEGRVRNHNNERSVEGLFYETYEDLALSEGERILLDAKNRFGVHSVLAIHRVGHLEIGDVAIWIQVLSSHRRAAFEACEWIMDQIKKTVPIWKREIYSDRPPSWLASEGGTISTRYDRQILLNEVGQTGQAKIGNSKVIVIGAGGLGSPVIEYLARAGVGHLTIVDPDVVDESNLNRQTMFGQRDVGKEKANSVFARVAEINPDIAVAAVSTRFDESTCQELISGHDVVVECTDDFAAKFICNDECVRQGIPMVSASIHRWQGQVFAVSGSPCLRCMMPTPPPATCVGTCEEEGILGTVAGLFGVLQANEVLKFILGTVEPLTDSYLAIDLRDYTTLQIAREISEDCPVCGCSPAEDEEAIEVCASQLAGMDRVVLVDLRTSYDRNDDLGFEWASSLEAARQTGDCSIVLVCRHGRSSLREAFVQRDLGVANVFSLKGGYASLTEAAKQWT